MTQNNKNNINQKIVFFDVDSTLCKIEGLDEIAKWKGVGDEVAKITKATMDGDMDFSLAFPKKIETIAPSVEDFEKLGNLYLENIVKGIEEVIRDLKEKNIKIGLMSGNFYIAVNKLVEKFDFNPDFIFCNDAEFNEDGSFKSFDGEQLLAKGDGKAKLIVYLKEEYPEVEIIFIGDSAGDMEVQGIADKFVGFGGVATREKVKAEAEYFITNMKELLEII